MNKKSNYKLINFLKLLSIVIIINIVYLGCGVNRYRQAELHLNHQDYKAALTVYKTLLHEAKAGKKSDTKAMVGAAIAYRNLGNYKACMKLCRKALKYKPNDAAALYYLGSSLEELGMEQLAMKFFGRYNYISRDDPYYSFLKARMNIIKLRNRDIN